MRFQFRDYTKLTVDDVFKAKASVDYRARLERVNKEFSKIAEQNDFYELRYPVEMSPVNILRSITQSEEAPFAVSIFNRSSKPIGIDTPEGRLLNFRMLLKNTGKQRLNK